MIDTRGVTIDSEIERAHWAPPSPITPSDWATAHRRIVSKDAAEPGPLRLERAPYMREILDALGPDSGVEEIYVMAAARVSKSECGRTALSYWVDEAPGPVLIVFPTEEKCKEQLENEIGPLLKEQPRLARWLTSNDRDIGKDQIDLVHMRIYPGWAGSPNALAERTIRYVWLSEIDKFPAFSGREADPMSLAKRRTQTWGHRRKIYAESTPTTSEGAIARAFNAATDRRRFHVPCPHCGLDQVLTWAQVKWPKIGGLGRREIAARIEAEELAWYECASCKGRIEERHKVAIVNAGKWVCEGTPGPIRGYHIGGMLSMLGLTWHRMAAQSLRAAASREEGDLGPLMEFITQSLGEPYEDQVGGVSSRTFDAKRAAAIARKDAPKTAPRWAGLLISSVDTQKDFFYWVTRAWGVFLGGDGRRIPRSRLLDRGRAISFEDLRRATIDARYAIAGWPGLAMVPSFMAIDARGGTAAATDGTDSSRTHEVYQFAKSDPRRIVPVAGVGGDKRQRDVTMKGADVVPKRIEYTPPGAKKGYSVSLHVLDTQALADRLAALIEQQATATTPEVWEVSADIDDEYVSHLTGEHKVTIPMAGTIVERWEKRSAGRRVDFLDCERYQLAAADIGHVDRLPDEAELTKGRTARALERAQASRPNQEQATKRFAPPTGGAFLANRRT